jgi:hypothetical protein
MKKQYRSSKSHDVPEPQWPSRCAGGMHQAACARRLFARNWAVGHAQRLAPCSPRAKSQWCRTHWTRGRPAISSSYQGMSSACLRPRKRRGSRWPCRAWHAERARNSATSPFPASAACASESGTNAMQQPGPGARGSGGRRGRSCSCIDQSAFGAAASSSHPLIHATRQDQRPRGEKGCSPTRSPHGR